MKVTAVAVTADSTSMGSNGNKVADSMTEDGSRKREDGELMGYVRRAHPSRL